MSYPYFITPLDMGCDYVGMSPYYASADLPENVTALYYDSALIYKFYTGQPQSIGWSTEMGLQSMYSGNMDSLGDITFQVPCTPFTTTTTTTAPYATWHFAKYSFGLVLCNAFLDYTGYTDASYASSPLTIPCFYTDTARTIKYDLGGLTDILCYDLAPSANSRYYADMMANGDLSGHTQCSNIYTYLVTQLGHTSPNDACGDIRDVYVYADTNIQSEVTHFHTNTGMTTIWLPDTYGYVSYVMPDYPSVVMTGSIPNSGGTLTYSGNCSSFPTTTTTTTYHSPIGFTIQPNSTDLYYARSPIVYRYSGLTISDNVQYYFNLYVSTGNTINNTGSTIYVNIDRKPDTYSGITVDVSNMLRTYLKNNLTYTFNNNNVVYFSGTLLEYSGNTKRSTKTSSIAKAVLGYTDYNTIGTFNKVYTYRYSGSTINEYPMNTYPSSSNYKRFISVSNSVKWRYTGISTGYNITYTNLSGSLVTASTNWPTGVTSANYDVRTIPTNYSSLPNIDTRLPISVYVMNCLDVIWSKMFYPYECVKGDQVSVNFLNRYGVWDWLDFLGRKDTQLDVTNETYKFNNVNYQTMTYNSQEGSYHMFNKQAKRRFNLNTGWVDEDTNYILEEILLSEYIQIDSMPYIIVDKSIKYKTNKWDKLINYTITFEQAYDTINNII